MPSTSPPAPIDDLAINAVLIAVRQAADVLCDRWSLMLLLLAHAGVSRFADFREQSGMANRQLTSRLTTLEAQEILVRMPYMRRPLRYGYHLTHMGLALFDVLATLLRWEHDWYPRPGATAVRLEHTACGAPHVLPKLNCAHCGEEVTARSVGELRVSQREIERMPSKATPYRRSATSAAGQAADLPAPLARGIDIFGDKWSIEIVVAAFMRVRSFGGFQAHTGISTNILADRLQRLVALNILRQTTALEPGRTGAYLLTAKAVALYPVLLAIQAWADEWLPDRLRSPIRLKHEPCGESLRLQCVCDVCRQPLLRDGAVFRIA